MLISDIAIRRPVFTTMVTSGLMVLGLIAFSRLGVDLFPDIAFPIVVVSVPYPGAGPEEVETLVTRPVEDAVASVANLDEMHSYSRDSLSLMILQFKLEADIRIAVSDVRDKVAAVRAVLPRDVRDPIVNRFDPTAMPVLSYAVSSPGGSLETRRIAEDLIKPAIERVQGVAGANVYGGSEREIRVELDAQKLEAAGLSPSQVGQMLAAEGIDVPAGHMVQPGRETGIRTTGRFQSVDDLGDVVLVAMGSTQVRLRDVAAVRDTVKEKRTLTRVDGVDSVSFDVVKQAGTNTVDICDKVFKVVAELEKTLPAGTKISMLLDSSSFIRMNMEDLKHSIVYGGAMAILVIFLFMLDWRSTFISALALPTSIVTTFFAMWMFGFTLNMISLMGLSLAIGLLIDDAVVVRENIFRHMERGEDPVTAARRGTGEIGLAVMATTFTVVAVFIPVAFTGSLVGRMLREFGLTVAAAVMVSLFVSFTLDPMLSARLVKRVRRHGEAEKLHPVLGIVNKGYDLLDGTYRRLLGWVLSGVGPKLVVVAFATIALFGSIVVAGRYMGKEFAPEQDRGEFMVQVELPPGTSFTETDRVTVLVEKAIREDPDTRLVFTTVGPGEDVSKARVQVKTTTVEERRRTIKDIQEDLRVRLAKIPNLRFTMALPGMGNLTEWPVMLFVKGPDLKVLSDLAEQGHEALRTTPGTADAWNNFTEGKPELRLALDRRLLGDAGLNVATVALGMRTAVDGDLPAKYREGDRDYDIRVLLRPEDRSDRRLLETLTFPSRRGRLVRLSEVARLEPGTGPNVIERIDRQRTITLTSNLLGRPLGAVVDETKAKLAKVKMPPGYQWEWAGQAKRMAETFSSLGLALGVAVIFIYLVLASQFESFVHPFTIMLSLPLAIVGALLALFLTGKALGMSSFIGIILLMGLVTKNAILLVDNANQHQHAGKTPTEALLIAGPTRLRPILMTSAAMVLGMLPGAMSRGAGSEFRAPMSTAVIAGVVTSTFLTLVVVPVAYTWLDRLRNKNPAVKLESVIEDETAGDPAPHAEAP